MTLQSKIEDKQKQQNRTQELVLCPIWHRPIFRVVPSGIEVKCKFCGGIVHTISREEIERQWKASLTSNIG